MVAVFSENLRVYNAIHFKQSLVDVEPHNLYLTYGRVTSWPNTNTDTDIPITYLGQPLDGPYVGYTPIQVKRYNNGYALLFQNSSNLYAAWQLNYLGAYVLTLASITSVESFENLVNLDENGNVMNETGTVELNFTNGKYVINDSNSPPQANSSVTSFNDIWKNMIGAKLLSGNDVRHAIPRNNWATNTNYAAYDHCTCSLLMYQPNVKFFIITTDWNVYKCLANNNGGLSNVMPAQIQTTTAIEESDGYIWKYMYTLSAEERIRFMTNDYIPVQTLTLDNSSLQWRVQQDAVDGAIEAVKVTNGGTNYSNSSNIIITISGDGSGAKAIARTNATNSITNVLITDKGQNYTYADITITAGGGANATARAMISPPGGHGYDPLRELGGSYLILNPRIRSSEDGKLPVKNEFRQIALIQDPKLSVSGNVATGRVYSQSLTITVSPGTDNYQLDETVYQGGSISSSTFSGIVVDWDLGNNQLKLTNTIGTPISAPLTGNTSATSRVLVSVTEKDLLNQSGQLLYIDYIEPITRSIDQTEDYKIVLKF